MDTPTQKSPHPGAPQAQNLAGGGREGSGSTSGGPAAPGWVRWVLGFSMTLGLLRFWRLGTWSFWYDEALTVADSFPVAGAEPTVLHNWGYRCIAWFSAWISPSLTEASMRWLPALAGFAVIPTAYWAFRTWAGPGRAALVSLLLASSGWQQAWSQTARGYTLAEWVTLLGVGCFFRAWQARSGVFSILGIALVGVSAKFHPHGALIAGGMCAGLAVFAAHRETRQQHRLVLRTVAVGALLVGLWQIPNLWEAFRTYRRGGAGGGVASFVHLAQSTGYYLTPVVGGAALIGAGVILKTGDRKGGFVLLVVCSVMIAAALLSGLGQVSAQYVFSLHPWMLLLAVWPWSLLNSPHPVGGERRRGGWSVWRWAGVSLLLLPSWIQLGLYGTAHKGERPRWSEAFAYVWQAREPHDLVLSMQAGLGDLYLNPGYTDVRSPRTVGWTDRWNPQNHKRVTESLRGTWVVVRPAFLTLWEPSRRVEFEDFLARECRLQKRFPLNLEGRDLDLEVYYRPGL